MDVRLPDGTVIQNVPDGISKADLTAKLSANGYDVSKLAAPAAPSTMDHVKQQAGNLVAGAVRGAGSIGATLLTPIDAGARALGIQNDFIGRNDRRQAMDSSLQSMGAQPDSLAYQVGKLGTEVAGTLGVGGALANGARALRAAPEVVNALATSGMRAGSASPVVNALTRAGAGATVGGASATLVDPSSAGTGALVGGAIPGATELAGVAGNAVGSAAKSGAARLMQSALKPTIAQLRSGDAKTAVQTLLDYGINPTESGVAKLKDLIDGLNNDISSKIGASNATVSKQNVVNALAGTRAKFGNQVSPSADLGAIDNVANDFRAHPLAPGEDIPVQTAQQMKQGTYKVLAGKYGQLGSAETEAQKSLARGLKDEIATAVPGVGALNAEESRLLSTLSVAERRALMDANKNPLGLAALAHNPAGWAAFMADKSAAFKALAARALNSAASGGVNALAAPTALNQLAYQAAPALAVGR